MNGASHEAMVAYLGTLGAIVLLTITAAVICISGNFGSAENIAKIIGALSFIGSAVTGLIGVIGTFRPRGAPAGTTESGNVNIGTKGEG